MIDFPEHEMQTYRFTLRSTHFMVTASEGNFEVYYSDSKYMPAPMEGSWVRLDDTDVLYWIGVVYAYKVTDDTTRNVYSSQDYRIMGAACQMLNQIPEFEDLEYIIGYSSYVGTTDYFEYISGHSSYVGTTDYTDWSDRAKEWLETQRRNSVVTNVHPLAEGAD